MKKLFEDNKNVLESFMNQMIRFEDRSEFEKGRNHLIRNVVRGMAGQSKEWDKLCEINIGWLGDDFINKLSDKDKALSESRLDDIAALCFQFLLERDLSMGKGLDPELEEAKNFAIDHADHFSSDAQWRIKKLFHSMPIILCKSVLNSDPIGSVKEFNSSFKKAEQLKATWDQELSEKEEVVNRLKKALEEYKTAFNFVGLDAGFDQLAKEKIAEKKSIFFWLRMLGVLAVAPIILELGYIICILFFGVGTPPIKTETMALVALPTISLVALLIYYFRVILFNYKSVKSQLMQIELRKALCRFIQSYADYSREIKANNPESLDRFEKIVFSEIMADEGNLPSMHDGVEQIAKMIKSIKKS